MANCTKITETVVRIKSITLDLDEAEAKTLSQLLSKIGGNDRLTGHRKRLNAIGNALARVGFNTNFELPEIGCGIIYDVEDERDHKIVRTND